MAEHGVATIAINTVGHGFGPLGTLTVRTTDGDSVTLSAGGRGHCGPGPCAIAAQAGLTAAGPLAIIGNRDGFRQTAVDLIKLTRVIEIGMDVDGDGIPDLDRSRIYYFGQSQGGQFGGLLLAVEPDILVGVLNNDGGVPIVPLRLGPAFRPSLGDVLASRIPSLRNAPGISLFAGASIAAPRFDDNLPLRDGIPLPVALEDGTSRVIQSPVINNVAGAMDIQRFVDNTEWVFRSGSSTAYASHLRKRPLAGVPSKSVIIQFAKGDMTNPNPISAALVRAGDLADRATFYRHDLAYAENPRLGNNPHGFLIQIRDVTFRPIVLAAQEQVAVFFATDGEMIIHPEPARFFEVPIVLPLPEDLNYIIP
jgi:hypothetical protein